MRMVSLNNQYDRDSGIVCIEGKAKEIDRMRTVASKMKNSGYIDIAEEGCEYNEAWITICYSKGAYSTKEIKSLYQACRGR